MFYGYQPSIGNLPYQNNMNSQQVARVSYVTCIDEARAAQIQLDGSMTVFINVQNGEIYTKQLDNNGLADLKIYRRVQALNQSQNQQYVSVKDFNTLCEKVKMLESNLGGMKNAAESNAINGNDAK